MPEQVPTTKPEIMQNMHPEAADTGFDIESVSREIAHKIQIYADAQARAITTIKFNQDAIAKYDLKAKEHASAAAAEASAILDTINPQYSLDDSVNTGKTYEAKQAGDVEIQRDKGIAVYKTNIAEAEATRDENLDAEKAWISIYSMIEKPRQTVEDLSQKAIGAMSRGLAYKPELESDYFKALRLAYAEGRFDFAIEPRVISQPPKDASDESKAKYADSLVSMYGLVPVTLKIKVNPSDDSNMGHLYIDGYAQESDLISGTSTYSSMYLDETELGETYKNSMDRYNSRVLKQIADSYLPQGLKQAA